eukprot:3926493-Pleurochrysis_carterae.AAC.1
MSQNMRGENSRLSDELNVRGKNSGLSVELNGQSIGLHAARVKVRHKNQARAAHKNCFVEEGRLGSPMA